MKIVFLQQLKFEWQAPMIFSAIAKKKGCETKLYIEGKCNKAVEKTFKEKPDLIVFASITMGNYTYVKKCAELIKKQSNILILVGGIHITMNYRNLDMSNIDIFGIGEGEHTFSGIIDMLRQKKEIHEIPGIAYRHNGELCVNKPKHVENLDSLLFPDYDLYYRYFTFRNEKVRMFYSGRGCNYLCKYCCVPYANRNVKRVRKRTPISLINEMMEVDQKYGMKAAFFQDDSFTQDKAWLKEFLPLYKKNIGKPLMCLSNAQDLDEDTIYLLKEYGCVSIGIGVETINNQLRHRLNRADTDQQIVNSLFYAKKAGLKITTFNILGLPDEALEDIKKTIDFYRYFKVDSIWCVLYQEFIKKDEEYKETNIGNFYLSVSQDTLNNKQIETIQKMMPVIVRHPWVLAFTKYKLVQKTAYLFFAYASYIREIKLWRRSIIYTFLFGIHNQYYYFKNSKYR